MSKRLVSWFSEECLEFESLEALKCLNASLITALFSRVFVSVIIGDYEAITAKLERIECKL